MRPGNDGLDSFCAYDLTLAAGTTTVRHQALCVSGVDFD